MKSVLALLAFSLAVVASPTPTRHGVELGARVHKQITRAQVVDLMEKRLSNTQNKLPKRSGITYPTCDSGTLGTPYATVSMYDTNGAAIDTGLYDGTSAYDSKSCDSLCETFRSTEAPACTTAQFYGDDSFTSCFLYSGSQSTYESSVNFQTALKGLDCASAVALNLIPSDIPCCTQYINVAT